MAGEIQVSGARTVREAQLAKTARKSGQPVQDALRIRYGIITAVDHEDSQVKVKLFTNAGLPDMDLPAFYPLINPLSEIHLLWGRLREGLAVRVFYVGKEDPPKNVLVEIIGDEGLSFLRKERKENVIATGPYKLMSGGLLG